MRYTSDSTTIVLRNLDVSCLGLSMADCVKGSLHTKRSDDWRKFATAGEGLFTRFWRRGALIAPVGGVLVAAKSQGKIPN